MFTHDFDVVMNIKHVYSERFQDTYAAFLANRAGQLTPLEINKRDIESFCVMSRKRISESEDELCKLIYARNLEEVLNGKSVAWEMLSSLFHKQEHPCRKNGREKYLPFTDDEVRESEACIKALGIRDFEYAEAYSNISDDNKLLGAFEKAQGAYQKIALFRILREGNRGIAEAEDRVGLDAVMKDFINGFFHIENQHLFQLDPVRYSTFPDYVVEKCEETVREYRSQIQS